MTTGRKVLLVLLAAVLIEAGVYWNANREENRLKIELDSIMAEADAIMKNRQRLPPPSNGVTNSYHDDKNGKKNYEDAWIDDIDKKKGIVWARTFDGKMRIVFKPAPENLEKFHKNWIAPVTFECTKLKKGKCDFESPYKLFVSNGLVEVKRLIFTKK